MELASSLGASWSTGQLQAHSERKPYWPPQKNPRCKAPSSRVNCKTTKLLLRSRPQTRVPFTPQPLPKYPFLPNPTHCSHPGNSSREIFTPHALARSTDCPSSRSSLNAPNPPPPPPRPSRRTPTLSNPKKTLSSYLGQDNARQRQRQQKLLNSCHSFRSCHDLPPPRAHPLCGDTPL